MTSHTPQASGRIVHLDGLRGVAILTVFAVHWARHQLPIFTGGYIGVDVFFVLSGFIITTLLVRRPPNYAAFIADRVRRLYPPLLGLLVVGTALIAVWPRSGVSLEQGWKSALVAGSQLTSPFMATGHNQLEPYVITWSLSVEWYFYLLWPLAVYTLTRLPRATAARWCLVGAAPLYAASLVVSADSFYFGPLARFAAMLAGAALAFWTLDGRRLPRVTARTFAWIAPAFIAAWTLIGPDVYSWGYRLAGFPLAVLCTIALIAVGNDRSESHSVVRVLEWRPLVWVGGISYSLYLWHTLPIALIPGDWYGLPMPVLGVIGLTMVALTTWLGFVFLEKPFRHRRGAELRPGVQDGTPAAPPT